LALLKMWSRRNAAFGPVCELYEHYISTVDPTGKSDSSNERVSTSLPASS
jgi:hypothetical protein